MLCLIAMIPTLAKGSSNFSSIAIAPAPHCQRMLALTSAGRLSGGGDPRHRMSESAAQFARLVDIAISQTGFAYPIFVENLRRASVSADPINPFINLPIPLHFALSQRTEPLMADLHTDWPVLRVKLAAIVGELEADTERRDESIHKTRLVNFSHKFEPNLFRIAATSYRLVGRIDGIADGIILETEDDPGQSTWTYRLHFVNPDGPRSVYEAEARAGLSGEGIFFQNGFFIPVGDKIVRIDLDDGSLFQIVFPGLIMPENPVRFAAVQGRRLLLFYGEEVLEYQRGSFSGPSRVARFVPNHTFGRNKYQNMIPKNFGGFTAFWHFAHPNPEMQLAWYDGSDLLAKAPNLNLPAEIARLYPMRETVPDWKEGMPVWVPIPNSHLVLLISYGAPEEVGPRAAWTFDPRTSKFQALGTNPENIPAKDFISELAFNSRGELLLRNLNTRARVLTTWRLDERAGQFVEPMRTDLSHLAEYFPQANKFLGAKFRNGTRPGLVFDRDGRQAIGFNISETAISFYSKQLSRKGDQP